MVSLREQRRDMAERYTGLKLIRTGVLYADVYSGTASGTAARRRIVSSDLATVRKDGLNAELDTSTKNYRWVWCPETAEQRRIVHEGYNGYAAASGILTGHNALADAEIVGYLTVDRAVNTAYPADTLIEGHGRFPVLSGEEIPGLHWAINEALQLMTWPFKLSVAGVTGTQRYDLHSTTINAWWVTNRDQLVEVFRAETDNTIGGDPMQGRKWLEPDGEHMWLYVPEEVSTGETFTVQLRRPCHTWIKLGGAEWRDSTVGLVNESDEALPAMDRVSAVAWAVLARRMALRGPKPEVEGWATEAERAEKACAEFLTFQVEASTPMRQKRGRVPWHPTGKLWQPMSRMGGGRRWP